MKTKHLAIALALVAFAASVPAAAEPLRPINVPPIAKLKSQLTVANASAVPGEAKALDATLVDSSGKPIAGKTLQLTLVAKSGGPALKSPISIGTAFTGANGHANFPWSCGDLLMGNYGLEASFAGDGTTLPSKGTGDLFVAKAQLKIGLDGDVALGVYKNEPGTSYGFTFTISRTSDNKTVDRTVTVTINGKALQVTTQYGRGQVAFTPQSAKTWDVQIQFNGDDYSIAAAGAHKYTHP